MKLLLLPFLTSLFLYASDHVVDQKNKTFIPGDIHVKVGDTITFKNSDPISHNAYTDNEANEFDVGMQDTGTEKTITVKAAEDFEIECAIHPNMLIKVKVDK